MPDDLSTEHCAACDRVVFDGRAVSRCAKCSAFVHQVCRTQMARCIVARCGGKKWTDVAVVRLQPPGPSLDEINLNVRAEVERIVEHAVTRLRAENAHRDDVEKSRKETNVSFEALGLTAKSLRERLDTLSSDMERRLADLRRAVSETQQAVAALKTVGPEELGETSSRIESGLREKLERWSAEVAASVAKVERAVVVESQRNFAAIEACRWDTAARRKPLPWDETSDRVLRPTPSPAEPSPSNPSGARP